MLLESAVIDTLIQGLAESLSVGHVQADQSFVGSWALTIVQLVVLSPLPQPVVGLQVPAPALDASRRHDTAKGLANLVATLV